MSTSAIGLASAVSPEVVLVDLGGVARATSLGAAAERFPERRGRGAIEMEWRFYPQSLAPPVTGPSTASGQSVDAERKCSEARSPGIPMLKRIAMQYHIARAGPATFASARL